MQTISKRRILSYTRSEWLELRHKVLMKAINRTTKFNDNKKNYYWYFLNDINDLLNKSSIVKTQE